MWVDIPKNLDQIEPTYDVSRALRSVTQRVIKQERCLMLTLIMNVDKSAGVLLGCFQLKAICPSLPHIRLDEG